MGSILKVKTGDKTIRGLFRDQCTKFSIGKLKAQQFDANGSVVQLSARYFGTLQSLCRQLATPTTRKALKFRQIVDRSGSYDPHNPPIVIHDFADIIKECVDGYQMKGGKNIELGTTTNICLEGAEHSTDATDILFIGDMDEDRYSRHLITQQHDKENQILTTLGFVDMATGEPIGVISSKCEDSKSLQMAVGRGSATSRSRLLFTRFPYDIQFKQWKKVFSPISFAAFGASCRWHAFVTERLAPYCNNHFQPPLDHNLVPYFRTSHCAQISARKAEYKKAYDWMMEQREHRGLQVSDWGRASSIRTMSVEPLHCNLRIPITNIKYLILGTIEYSEWIGAPEQEDVFKANHGSVPNYRPCTTDEILYHARNCLGIPFSYDKDNPTTSSITAEGSWKRTLWTKLEGLVYCEKCGYHPFNGSPVEPFITLLLINMMEMLVPLEILRFNNYDKYWRKNLKQKFIHRRRNTFSDNMENEAEGEWTRASAWNVHAMHWYVLFMYLLGPARMTRYVHGVVFGTQHGFEVAHSLQVSYRALFGADVVERMNSLTKAIALFSSSKFGGIGRDPEDTLEQIITWILWDRYQLRANSSTLNLYIRLQTQLKERQQKTDEHNMSLPAQMRARCRAKNIPYRISCELSNEMHREGGWESRSQDDEDIYFYTRNVFAHLQTDDTRESDTFAEHLTDIMAHVDNDAANRSMEAIFGARADVNSDEDNDCDVEETRLKRRFYKIHAVCRPMTDIEALAADFVMGEVSDDDENSDQFCCAGRKCISIPNMIMAVSDWNFGARWMRLTTVIQMADPNAKTKQHKSKRKNKSNNNNSNKNNRKTKKKSKKSKLKKYPCRCTWKYLHLFRASCWRDQEWIVLALKMAAPPQVELKINGTWVAQSTLPPVLSYFETNGLFTIFLQADLYDYQDIEYLMRKHSYITHWHRFSVENDLLSMNSEFTNEEKQSAINYYREKRTPLLCSHKRLAFEIEQMFKQMREGGTHQCLSCKQDFQWFERHVICTGEEEEVDNVHKNIWEKLIYDEYTEPTASMLRFVVVSGRVIISAMSICQ